MADLAEQLVLATVANRGGLRRLVQRTRRAGRALADAASLTATARARAELGEDRQGLGLVCASADMPRTR